MIQDQVLINVGAYNPWCFNFFTVLLPQVHNIGDWNTIYEPLEWNTILNKK